jgi:uncharacterized membrane protein
MARQMSIGNRIAPPHFLLFLALLIGGGAIGMTMLPRAQAVMVAFDVAALVFLLLCIPLFRYEADDMRQKARDNDANRFILLLVQILVSMVILITIAGELVGPDHPAIADKLLIVVTLALAWVGANTVYTLHYAHLYYTSDDGGKDLAGLDFPGERPEPDYFDFFYFAFTLGAALQTSDVMVTSPGIRRIVILHCLEAFVFNTVVLALAISILTG